MKCLTRKQAQALPIANPAALKTFSDWSEAFDFCRERNAPVRVCIIFPADAPGVYTLFPSGQYRTEKLMRR